MALPPELEKKISLARTDRSRHQSQINEFLRMADPTRPRIGDNDTGVSQSTDRSQEADDRFDTTMEEVYEDFASDLLGRVMPRETDWLTYEPAEAIPDEVKRAIEDPLKARSKKIFDTIRASNFYDEAAAEWAMDQAHGTSATVIQDPGAGQPIECEAIPPGQLLIVRGSKGLNFRARECFWEIGEAVAFWPNYEWPEKLKKAAANKNTRAERKRVILGATLIPTPADERWLWQVCVDDMLVHEETVEGCGSCPILVTRWRTHSSSAWGIGPLRKAVPDARTLDQERYLVLKNLGKIVDPVVSYEDDNLTDPDAGVGPGMWLPRMPGSKAPEAIGIESRMDLAYFEQAGLQDSIRRAGYQDGPRQRGKTPPTLGQWTDEKAEQGRRMEIPTGKLYKEGVVAVVERFEYLLVKRGTIEAAIPSGEGVVKVRPLNPLARQQDYEKVTTATQLLQTGNQTFGPQVMGALIDGAETFKNMKKALSDDLVVVREGAEASTLLNAALGADPTQQGGAQPPPDAGPGQ